MTDAKMQFRVSTSQIVYFGIALATLLAMLASTAAGRSSWVFIPAGISLTLVLLVPNKGLRDPTVLLKLVAAQLFAISPVYIVAANVEADLGPLPQDWQNWLTYMAWVNVGSLLLFLGAMRLSEGRVLAKRVWILDLRRFRHTLLIMLALSAVLQVFVYQSMGGIGGYVESYEERSDTFQGMGLIFSLSEAFPILFVIGYAVAARRYKSLRNIWLLLGLMALFLALKFAFGGLRGSRGSILWSAFWAFSIIDTWVRRIPRSILAGFAVLGAVFVVFYGFYKAGGSEVALEAMSGDFEAAAARTGRGIDHVITKDLSRAEVQAFLLYRLENSLGNYANGSTYLGTLALAVPRSIWPERPEPKRRHATEILYGPELTAHGYRSTRVYGLGGESLMNFGVPGVLVAYGLFGVLVGLVRGFARSLHPADTRTLLVPLGACWLALALMNDSDNLFFFSVKHALLPSILVLISSRRVRVKS